MTAFLSKPPREDRDQLLLIFHCRRSTIAVNHSIHCTTVTPPALNRPSSSFAPFFPIMPRKSSKKASPVVCASRCIAGLLCANSVRPPTCRLAGLLPADSARPSQPATHNVTSSSPGESSFPYSIIKFSNDPSHSRFQYPCCRQAVRCV